MDPLEQQLKDLEEGLTQLWQHIDDPTSSLGDLVALCAAIRQCYREQHGSEPGSVAPQARDTTTSAHWSDEWRREHGV